MEQQSDILFIFPPLWTVASPSTGISQLRGFLSERGYKSDFLDLNILLYRHILTKDFLFKTCETIIQNEELRKEAEKICKLDYFKNNIIPNIYSLLNLIKSGKIFSSKKLFERTYSAIIVSRDLVFISRKMFSSLAQEDWDSVKKFAYSEENNFFYEFYEMFFKEKDLSSYRYIGISVNSSEQLYAGLTLARYLKQKTKAKIVFGGSALLRNLDILKTDKKFFDDFSQIVTYSQLGEKPTLQILEYIDGKRDIFNVSGIVYKNSDNEIVITKEEKTKISDVSKNSFDGVNLNLYFCPLNILPIRVTSACYYGKCTFCDYNLGKTFSQRSVDDVINEIKELKEKHNVNAFFFSDASLSPSFLREFASEIIKQNLKIYYICNLRFEKDFSKDLLLLLYNSGLRIARWGLESASNRILKLMKKGIEPALAQKILADSAKIGLNNHLYVIACFPTETDEEFDETYDFLMRNFDNINSVAMHIYFQGPNYVSTHKKEFYGNISEEEIQKQQIPSQHKRRLISQINEKFEEKAFLGFEYGLAYELFSAKKI